jgi:phospholipid/cholesterol/gamma-HCH transport system ATP-binding protein
MPQTNLIEVSDLSFSRGQRLIFDGLSISVPQGSVTAIMGPSGCGKTTLLRLIGGQLQPTQGKVQVFGEDLSCLNREALTRMRSRMGVLFQSGALFTDLDVFENVAFPLREHSKMNADELHDAVLLKLEAVGLRGAKDLMPAELSGGMARRVALARAIAMGPELLLYDEPFAGQDPIAMAVLQRLIRSLNDELNLTSVLVSHDVAEACAIADQVILLGRGNLLAQGSPESLLNSTDPMVSQFMHGQADGAIPFHYPAAEITSELRTNAALAKASMLAVETGGS